jgi:hypothetical protein
MGLKEKKYLIHGLFIFRHLHSLVMCQLCTSAEFPPMFVAGFGSSKRMNKVGVAPLELPSVKAPRGANAILLTVRQMRIA